MSAARMPATLLAQTDAPTPLPQIATPRSDLSRDHGLGQRHDEVRIVVFGIQRVRAEVDDLVAGGRAGAARSSSFRLNPP